MFRHVELKRKVTINEKAYSNKRKKIEVLEEP
jgi:hypothetical protein